MKILVDGDACPVKDEIVRVATRTGLPVTMVSNQGLRAALGPNVTNIMVGAEFDAADHWIVDHCAPDDIVITADIQLAARCLEKHAHVLGPSGQAFTADNIGSALAGRELSAYLREAGEIKGHNPGFTKQDRSQFLQALDTLIGRIKRGAK